MDSSIEEILGKTRNNKRPLEEQEIACCLWCREIFLAKLVLDEKDYPHYKCGTCWLDFVVICGVPSATQTPPDRDFLQSLYDQVFFPYISLIPEQVYRRVTFPPGMLRDQDLPQYLSGKNHREFKGN